MTNIFFFLFPAVKKRRQSEPARHAKKSWKHRAAIVSFSNVILALTILFLFLPLIVIIAYSFNDSRGAEFTRLSLTWYKALIFDSRPLWEALLNSLIVAFTSAAVSTLLASLAAIGCSWYTFRGRKSSSVSPRSSFSAACTYRSDSLRYLRRTRRFVCLSSTSW